MKEKERMKKTYIKPASDTMELRVRQVLMSSTITVSGDAYDEGNMTDLVKEDVFGFAWDDDEYNAE